ncbi:conjugal transfer protein TraB [Sodalis-like symbiont of Philaenus spumarius]|nr:conjugal transfer protein TraB [Sodalis-like symbiont of Philaenus spumarius]OZI14531.1 conjugal transfer protein TraB [Sodalis-like symbiont of Philaenus spumarius]
MRNVLRRLASLWGALTQATFPWPGMDVSLTSGRQFYLVGSIHMGTSAMAPLPARLLERLEQAQALIVEADITVSPLLTNTGEPQTPLADRLNASHYDHVRQLSEEYHLDLAALDALPAWHLALLLQSRQAERLGLRADYGIDYQLIQAARANDQPIIELEGPEEQRGLLRKLPDQGAALLADTLTHWHTNARLLQVMIGWWLESRPVNVRQVFPATFRQDLYHYLMTDRNYRWKSTLQQLPPGAYLVAVGALHLYGADNLPGLLRQ